jgi:excinuclease ABC subunit C
MMKRHPWQPSSGDIPQSPGVYRFLNSKGSVIYVGKAKNLRSRLSSYFQDPSKLHERTRRMVGSAGGLDWTLVPTERQALQLEFLWIKEFSPEFNVRFRDDKSYPYLVVTLSDAIPRVFLARKKGIKGARYFGPFHTAIALRDTLSTIIKAFPVRSCTETVYSRAKRTGRPCLLGDIGKCAAPCVDRISQPDHKALALSLASFMEGNDGSVVRELQDSMRGAAEAFEFERAAKFRDRIDAISTILVKNTMVLEEDVDADIFGVANDALVSAAHVFRVRAGRIRSAKGFILEGALDENLVELILRDGFDDFPPAKTVVIPELPPMSAQWEQHLSGLREEASLPGKVTLRVAKRGELAELQKTVTINAEHTLQGYVSSKTTDPQVRSRALGEIQNALGLEEAPLRIECFDVSHLGGDNPVASMVVFEDGIPKREHYRKFAITDVRDDTDAIAQVVSRRLARLTHEPESPENQRKGFSYPPGLLVIDGGLPQVNAAKRALDEAGMSIPVCGLAKKLEEVWTPGAGYPIILPRNSDGMFLLQRVRDEAHRVALRYQKTTRRRVLGSELSSIDGVGPTTVANLLRHFGSLKKVQSATLDELLVVEGVGPALGATILAHFRTPQGSPGTMGTPQPSRT